MTRGVMHERRRYTAADREDAPYRYVPFEVPAGAAGVSVRVSYERRDAVVDVGLLDPERFRGWSGSDKLAVAVGPERATPGYLAGPLPAGEWQVLLGLHRLWADAVEVEVEVEVGPVELPPPPARPALPERPPRRALPAADGRRWLAGDLHSHTVHSDGILTVPQLACPARERGLDFLAVTDHNTTSAHAELPAVAAHTGVVLVPGVELTTDRGHANCLGADRWIDFRAAADEWLPAVEAAGGLLSINHPVGGDMSWRHPIGRRPPFVEVWHSSWDRSSGYVLDWWREWGAGVAIGGSDFHRFGRDGLPGEPTTWLEVEDEDVLGALRAGRIAISAAPDGPVLLRHDGELVALDAEGTTLLRPDGGSTRVPSERARLAGGEGLHRLVAGDGLTVALVA